MKPHGISSGIRWCENGKGKVLQMRVKNLLQLYTDPVSFVCGIITGGLIVTAFRKFFVDNVSPFFSWDAVGAVGTVFAAIIAVWTYRSSVKRQRKQDTIREFSVIREKYPNLSPKAHNPVSDEVRTAYLKEMERFCTGVNIGLYDAHVVNTMAGTMLITQYDNYLGALVEERRKNTVQNADADNIYCEYKKFIEQIRKCHKGT